MSNIQWTDRTWNPVTGCTKVSQGCKNCYAEGVANRKLPGHHFDDRPFTEVRCHPERLKAPLQWRKPVKVFVNSMSDLFHQDVPIGFIESVFGVMAMSPQHTFQVLTKRPERMQKFMAHSMSAGFSAWAPYCDHKLPQPRKEHWEKWPLPNVWLGVSVEDQATADERIPLLLKTPAAVRFVSAEPALGPVNFTQVRILAAASPPFYGNALYKSHWCPSPLDWVIVGGESGPGARPFDVRWVRQIVKQCRAAGVPLFVKQMGRFVIDRNDAGFEGDEASNWPAVDVDETPYGYITGGQGDDCRVLLKDRKGGDMSEWPEDLRVREWPEGRA